MILALSYYEKSIANHQRKTVSESDHRRHYIPAGFPEKITSPMVWSGTDFQNDARRYSITLNESQIIEIEAAYQHFEGTFTA